MRRRIRIIAAALFAGASFSVFTLSSMSGPLQIDFLLISALCDAGLVALVAIGGSGASHE